MTPEQFCYWIQGYSEIRDGEAYPPSHEEWAIIQDHLQTVFKKETPAYNINEIVLDKPLSPSDFLFDKTENIFVDPTYEQRTC